MYKPEPRMLRPEDLNPIPYAKFVSSLKSLAVQEYKLNPKTILPCRSVCSDESEAQVTYALDSFFGNSTFNFGRVGGLIAVDRTPAAAHHGKELVIVAATHVGYNPKLNELNSRFGSIFRPRMGLNKEDGTAYSTCCGKLLGTISPFLKLYNLASNKKINIVMKKINGEEKYCIVINNHLLKQKDNFVMLNLNYKRLIKHLNDMPIVIEGRANSTVYELSEQFYEQHIKDKFNLKEESPVPIGKLLTSEYFTFEQSNILETEEGSHLILKNLLPYMSRIVSHPIPELAVANITIAHEFSKAVTLFRTQQEELGIVTRAVLLVAGINLNVYDEELAKKDELLGYQVYFCPYGAYFKPDSGNTYGKVLEREELVSLLRKQKNDSTMHSLTEAVRVIPKEIEI
jgi:hypothetical protein